MNITKRVPGRAVVAAAALVAAAGLVAPMAVAASADDPSPFAGRGAAVDDAPQTPVWIQVRNQHRLCDQLDVLPSYWPATQAMRRQAEQPLGDATQRAEWRRDAELLPSYWPAAQAMRAAAAQRTGC